MANTLSGKVSAFMLAIFIGQLLAFALISSIEGLLTIISFSHLTRYTAIIGLIVGIIGLVQEKGRGKMIPVLTLVISVGLLVLNGYLMFYVGLV